MAKTLKEKLAALSPQRRERIEKRTAELLAEVRSQQAKQTRSEAANGPDRPSNLPQAAINR
ncbi:hypothetical protein JCM31598_19810 [Desulfonatronum parangueonense]